MILCYVLYLCDRMIVMGGLTMGFLSRLMLTALFSLSSLSLSTDFEGIMMATHTSSCYSPVSVHFLMMNGGVPSLS